MKKDNLHDETKLQFLRHNCISDLECLENYVYVYNHKGDLNHRAVAVLK